MQGSLVVVGLTGTCSFCWRTAPVEHLHAGADGETLFCNDMTACAAEFARWDAGWQAHPEYARMAEAS